MSFSHRITRQLDEEHREALATLERFERAVARRTAAGDAAMTQALAAFIRLVEHDIGRHFGFEEDELFTRLAEAGEGDIAELLSEEHETLRAVAAELLPLARAAAAGTLAADGWGTLQRTAGELVERQVSHIQKETMAMLPLLDDWLDEPTDAALSLAYAEL
ncbi:MAG: hemerythrin domain-containing protein [Burkholderiales bacterium]|nr:hemerythrin domain-containing protein [Burkholderiales bacterium]